MRFFMTLLLIGSIEARGAEWRVGAAAVDVTPALGTPMAGYYSPRGAESVHDPLFAKAIVVENEGRKIALVSLDLITTTRDLVVEARKEIERLSHIQSESVMISATHTHTGPVVASATARDVALGGSNELATRFRAELPARIAEAVRRADDRLVPAKIWAARGSESSIAFNRRYHMKDGTVGWNPGKLNPNVLKPAGTIDPEVPFVYCESLDRKPIAIYINYAVHLDNVGGTSFSADMPYTLSRMIAEFKGKDLISVFTAGCCGDVNHINTNWREVQHGHENAVRMGVILAGSVLSAWPELEAIEPARIDARSVTVELATSPIEPGDLDRARAVLAAIESKRKPAPSFLETVKAYKVMDVNDRSGKPLEVEVQTIALGEKLAFVSLPGEIFVELGLAVKQDSPFPYTIIAELANGSIGYIPSRRAYPQGNYEVVSARCAQGSGEVLVDAAVRLLKESNLNVKRDAK